MLKIASVALSAALGFAAVAHSSPAAAQPLEVVTVAGPGVPRIGVEPVYYRPHHYERGWYGRPGYYHYGHERFYRHWDRC
jgi:hypothetical protein